MEFLVFGNLLTTDNINIINTEEIINVCYIIFLTITIFFKFTNIDLLKESKKINFNKFSLIYKKYLEIKEFQNYCFIHSILFELIKYLNLNDNLKKDFLKNLEENTIIPNLNITMNFLQENNKYIDNKKPNTINISYFIEENNLFQTKFNKNRKTEIERFYRGLNIFEEFSYLCCQHDHFYFSESSNFKDVVEIKNMKNFKCKINNKENTVCDYFIFLKDKSFTLYHPIYLLLFLINKIIKNNSLTFYIDKFFTEKNEEEYFYNILFYFKIYNLDIEILFDN